MHTHALINASYKNFRIKYMVLTCSLSLIFNHFNVSSIQLVDVNLFTLSTERIALFITSVVLLFVDLNSMNVVYN